MRYIKNEENRMLRIHLNEVHKNVTPILMFHVLQILTVHFYRKSYNKYLINNNLNSIYVINILEAFSDLIISGV